MKLSAFTLVKNAIKFDYPIVESVKSLLPFVDEYVINVGRSEDGTEVLIGKNFAFNPKIKLFTADWEGAEYGVAFFASQTNLALEHCSGDWAFYLQADECIHENDGPKVRNWVERAEAEGAIGVTCNYKHFEKSPGLLRKTYADGADAYDKEIRIIKNNGSLLSFGDAQGFCTLEDFMDPRGPQTFMHHPDKYIESSIDIYHYGYLKNPKVMLRKKKYLSEFYDVSEPSRKEAIPEKNGEYVYSENLKPFNGTHPKVMSERIRSFTNGN